MAPFRQLLSKSQSFMWDQNMETAVKKSKEKIIELIIEGFASFDMNLDFSEEGMGWILQQKTFRWPEIVPTCCKEGWNTGSMWGSLLQQIWTELFSY